MQEKLVLLDGHSMLNRAFYGMPDLTNAKGVHTGAVYGFLSILFRILDDEKPDYLLVAFDTHAPTFRHKAFADYKGTRHAMPEELREQVPLMKQVLTAMGVARREQEGIEADDILGTIAQKAEKEGLQVCLVSGDRDLLQIASDTIKIRIPKTKGGTTVIEEYYAKDVQETLGVTPSEFIQVKALQGDSSDNIPGVPKVGPKTATELIQNYHSVDGVYEHLSEITKKGLHQTLADNEELARMSLFLATIKTDCDVAFTKEECRLDNLYTREAFELYTELGFKNFLPRFARETSHDAAAPKAEVKIAETGSEAKAVFEKALSSAHTAVFPLLEAKELTPGGTLFGLALCTGDGLHYLPVNGTEGDEGVLPLGQLTLDLGEKAPQRDDPVTSGMLIRGLQKLRREAGKDGKILTLFGAGDLYPFLGIEEDEFDGGIRLDGIHDLLLAAYLVNPLKSDYAPEDVASEYARMTIVSETVFLEKKTMRERAADTAAAADYACQAAQALYASDAPVFEKLQETGMNSLYEEMELPLSYILYDMRRIGIRVLPDKLKSYGDELTGRIEELEKSIHAAAGCDFNIASPKQLGEILFEKMGIPGGKKTKTGYSTAADVLEKLSADYPFVADVLEYRGLTKLKSTYAEGLAAFIADDSRIHTNFRQTITATGRISSADPNLQNIPMRTELGRAIRKVFVPEEGYCFADADYSQIELRILASMSGDEALIEAYRSDSDIHTATASKVFGVPVDQVTPAMRRDAKAVNFGIVYGISSFGLSQNLSISKKQAQEYIEQYFTMFPGIKAFLDEQVRFARENGYSVTLFGRRRPIPEMKSSNFMQRSFGERVAMNAPIQGTGADIMKRAMITVWQELHRRGLKSRLILQIHDELLIETCQGEEKEVLALLESGMKGACSLKVELNVESHTGSDWYEAK